MAEWKSAFKALCVKNKEGWATALIFSLYNQIYTSEFINANNLWEFCGLKRLASMNNPLKNCRYVSRLQKSCHKDLQMQRWQSFHPLTIKNLLNIYADFVIPTHCPWNLKFSHQRIIIWKTTTTEQKYNFLNVALPPVPDYFAHLLSLWNKRATPYFVMMQCEHDFMDALPLDKMCWSTLYAALL